MKKTFDIKNVEGFAFTKVSDKPEYKVYHEGVGYIGNIKRYYNCRWILLNCGKDSGWFCGVTIEEAVYMLHNIWKRNN